MLVIACGYVAANLLTDLAYQRLDPRVRFGPTGGAMTASARLGAVLVGSVSARSRWLAPLLGAVDPAQLEPLREPEPTLARTTRSARIGSAATS